LETLTIADLNRQVRELLRGVFPGPLWVVGEIADFDKSAGKASRFFKLVDKQEGSDQRRAEVCAVLFADTARVLQARLRQMDEPLTLRDGIEIRARVRVDLWPEGGQYRLVIEDIDPTFTLGKLALDRERILQQLRSKGLERRNLELLMPCPALRIGVLASPESDGWTDLLRHLQESAIGFQVTLVPIRVQGHALRPTLLAGLRWFAAHADDHDLVCIIRGGGSRTDLAWFDDLEVALAVARHPLKILVGIGHQRDRSVLDEIAHSEKTPTAVAAFLTAQVHLARSRLGGQLTRLRLCSLGVLADRQGQVQELAARLAAATHGRLRLERERLELKTGRLLRESRRLLRGERDNLRTRAAALQRSVRLGLERANSVLQGHADRLRLLDPRTVLARGFALVRGSNGRILPDVRSMIPGQELAIHLRDGIVHSRATFVEPHPEP
jgi:exodeoxyribonuclease VII large subunit